MNRRTERQVIKRPDDLLAQARREAEFFDKVYDEVDALHRAENYIIPEHLVREVTHPGARPISYREYACSLLGDLKEKKLLDYGAGDGWNSVCFAKAGAKVWAMDISKKSIELVKKKAVANGVAEAIIAEVRDCYDTGFPSDMFDVIYGNGILHHLAVAKAGRELNRILRPEGVAVFNEPMRESRVLDVIKAVVMRLAHRKPQETTENEAPLTKKGIAPMGLYFKTFKSRQFEVVSAANALIRSKALRRLLLWADDLLIRCVPEFEPLGRAVVIELRRPVKGL